MNIILKNVWKRVEKTEDDIKIINIRLSEMQENINELFQMLKSNTNNITELIGAVKSLNQAVNNIYEVIDE